jgi:hypothetical protein
MRAIETASPLLPCQYAHVSLPAMAPSVDASVTPPLPQMADLEQEHVLVVSDEAELLPWFDPRDGEPDVSNPSVQLLLSRKLCRF